MYNDQSAYTSGLIVPNRAVCLEYVQRQHEQPGSIESYKLILSKIYDELMKFRKGGVYEGMFPERWLPAVVGILPEPFSEQNGTINSTSKVVRRKVYEIFREELEFIYTPEGKEIRNTRNTRNIKKLFMMNNG